ncbi:hypothetical protein FACS189472_10780 [Alphaproteobacteria bacterium]|nr:hypothetical protein FACS189472_10780 [Alphaproteobacteria bacterium]
MKISHGFLTNAFFETTVQITLTVLFFLKSVSQVFRKSDSKFFLKLNKVDGINAARSCGNG